MEALEGPSLLGGCSALKCEYDSIVLFRPSYRKKKIIINNNNNLIVTSIIPTQGLWNMSGDWIFLSVIGKCLSSRTIQFRVYNALKTRTTKINHITII